MERKSLPSQPQVEALPPKTLKGASRLSDRQQSCLSWLSRNGARGLMWMGNSFDDDGDYY